LLLAEDVGDGTDAERMRAYALATAPTTASDPVRPSPAISPWHIGTAEAVHT
jgi:hypothetical protein